MLSHHMIIISSPLTVVLLFLHDFTSWIKLILWLSFSTDRRQAEDMVKDPRVLLHFYVKYVHLCNQTLGHFFL